MPKFCANLSMLFKELPLIERFGAAKEAGFDAVEVLFPYDDPAQDIVRELVRHDLTLVLINAPPPNWTGGDRGFAAMPGREARFRHDFKRALRYAETLKAKFIHIMAGVAEGDAARQTFIDNLIWAAAHAPKQQLTIEPINTDDMPGYFLCDFDQALGILDAVGAPNLSLQFDAYHAHKITGDMQGAWTRCRDRAAHIQVSDPDGRHEPSKKTIDYPAYFAQLDAEGYGGFVSAEYNPRGQTEAGLDWMR